MIKHNGKLFLVLREIYRKIIPEKLRKTVFLITKNIKIVLHFIVFAFKNLFFKTKIDDYKDIPIIINNRNHYTYLKKLITFLENNGYKNIIILDNDSTYQPLLEYYRQIPYRIVYLGENLGYMAINKCTLFDEIKNDYYVYTDPDVLPIEACPENFLEYFISIMKKHLLAEKVGFSLKIDDLPDCYKKKQDVLRMHKCRWENEIEHELYFTQIDTTFALHRPGVKCSFLTSSYEHCKHYRTGYPYTARHLPWYEDSDNLPDDISYYYSHTNSDNNW